MTTPGLFLQAMKKMCMPTMIVTSSSVMGSSPMDYHGLTITSMASLSINPRPLVQFNVRIPSATSTNLWAHNLFAIHFLNPETSSVSLAQRFAKHGLDGPSRPFMGLKQGLDYSLYKNNLNNEVELPILEQVDRILICKKKDAFAVQDHEIWVGEVVDILNRKEEVTGGVLHCNKKFFQLGDEL
ncbi:hypothetical protein KAFR_0K01600 [Kazachstania africana CBS 2517]|uniref:Flavin reductase like domain-containing protein n=1 Tax=Kazachstania africana (strain ATCC 22294 / BCRC 22015 / CBS 2517 / CECT 1963 / NBRC 1671 / NRRL Y-8276) TaxID=1071382 RepID=H2B1L4_KAZAF|nr:hypothetical protein KAFR_0K01600 [Kazachstania africana CBS 2517]CCF60514.1 hypothetical protein KAFR_0K01600 [Kazachstania africana CBS 2517]